MTTTPATPATDHTTALRSGYAAFAAGDLPVVLALLDPEIEWVEAAGGPYGGVFRGPQAVVDGLFARIGAEWPEFRVEPEEYIAAGDTVAVLGTYRGTYGATGTAMTTRFVHVWKFRDDLAIRFEQVADTATLNTALT